MKAYSMLMKNWALICRLGHLCKEILKLWMCQMMFIKQKVVPVIGILISITSLDEIFSRKTFCICPTLRFELQPSSGTDIVKEKYEVRNVLCFLLVAQN